ncbi:hypothetical protein [Kibdelosporangium aridum]|uniref:hypothetical protein n=1 Tax=Kibdelosporangium aridum TaxID=2030 RepID=UPI0005252C3A
MSFYSRAWFPGAALNAACVELDARGDFRAEPITSAHDLHHTITVVADLLHSMDNIVQFVADSADVLAERQTETVNDPRIARHLTVAASRIRAARLPVRHCREATLTAAEHSDAAVVRLKRVIRPAQLPRRYPDVYRGCTGRSVRAQHAVTSALSHLNQSGWDAGAVTSAGTLNCITHGLVELTRRLAVVTGLIGQSARHQSEDQWEVIDDERLAEYLDLTAECATTATSAIRYAHRLLTTALDPVAETCTQLNRRGSATTPLYTP